MVSHPWLAKHHPDLDSVQLRLLVAQMDALGTSDDDGLFLDYISLPQHNGSDPELQRLESEGRFPEPGGHPSVRTEAEDVIFRKALASMEQLYSVSSTPVIVLPMEEYTDDDRSYISRGWCLLEFCLALIFGNIANADVLSEVSELRGSAYSQRAHTVEGFRQAFGHSSFTSKGDADVVMRLFENTLSMKARSSYYSADGHQQTKV